MTAGKRGRGQPAPHATQKGAATPGQRASAAAGNVAEPHRAPSGHRSTVPASSTLPTLSDDVKSELARVAFAMISARGELPEKMEIVLETFSERAAIREYLGGHPRSVAEHLAIVDTCEILGVRYQAA